MGIIAWIIVGGLAGLLAKAFSPGEEAHGFFITIFIGIVGACVGGFVANMLGHHGARAIDLYSIMVSTVGAVLVLALYKMSFRRA